jgi:hypothetical protein
MSYVDSNEGMTYGDVVGIVHVRHDKFPWCCPYCTADSALEVDEYEFNATEGAWVRYSCGNCDSVWAEVYKFDKVCFFDGLDENHNRDCFEAVTKTPEAT